jgi:hypothetical protein
MRSLSRPFPFLLPCSLLLCLAAAAALAEPVRVDNGADPAEGLVTAGATEMWRAGGEDDDIFFGNVARVAVAPTGEVLLLDSQLSEVQVYAADGAHLRTLGREGDGPGEMRRPNDFFVMPDGTVCVLQGFGGRIVKLTGDGMPAGEGSFTPAQGSGQFSVMIRGLAAGPDIVLAGIKMAFEGGVSTQTYFLTRCDAAGVERATLVEKSNTIDYSDFVMTEMDMDFVWSRMAVAPTGEVYAAPERNAYTVHVFGADGTPARVITRQYASLERDDERKDIQRRIIEGIGANYPRPPHAIEIEDTDPVVTAMWVLDDGSLWVQTGRGDNEPPAGCWTVLDVFDGEGRFTRQVALPGDHDALRDGLHMLPDGRAVVVIGALDAYLNQQAVGGEEAAAAAEEPEPLEIICYDLEI